tara:strand:+ start:569 stop:1294 length:726 start_codon:yes stop_codon:yes gene_type:complete
MLDKEETPKETVLITGAGQRVGLHCAQRLVADGYQVVITCRRLRPEWEVNPLKGIEVMLADFSSEQGINAFIRVLQERAHSLRAIIHNASTWIDDDLVDGPAFQRLCMVHMQAPYMINMACASLFSADTVTDIIHITDHDALNGADDHIAYLATKAGLENLTRSFAMRLAPSIKVNSIAPALIMFNDGDSEEQQAKLLARSALGFEPGPEVVYQAVKYVMNNPYITGTCLDLNGGGTLKFA